ncbi:UPF0223 family protein [Salisediminibacterium selenitireducens]|uniref:Uncharacterized protein n=1 Tax=Bacillus selenitireducens (strain ATCC 700615 / DSM 15326 / MLS10) TaxID=439292 RepID=D6XTI5_BACIE|nr:UPF0223 family protein [Salisediminibacterium selenitireducens]ADH99121.1 protein of unknown function UPF0223 [[Bacillus] selenitireducens MLS10]
MSEGVQLPVSMDWSTDEVIDVVNFFEAVDSAYGKGVERDLLVTLYRHYKAVVPSKAEEKQHFKDYESQTGQSPYHTVKKARESETGTVIKMSKNR